jgi:uncharacterized protein (DUF488 family)
LATFFTIGHSTRALDDFLCVLKAHRIQTLADIRAFPKSKRLPHFNRESLEASLAQCAIQYVWMPTLGGYRKKIRNDSPHVALRSDAFRNYADYTLTREFASAIDELRARAEVARTVSMCAEFHYANCHRRIVSDYLTAHSHAVLHITDETPPQPHQLTHEARVIDGQLIYRGDRLF